MAIPAPGRHRSNSDSISRTSLFTRTKTDAFPSGYTVTPPSSYKGAGLRYLEDGSYPNATTFQSREMTITISSPSVRGSGRPNERALPVFGDHDRIPGTVSLDPSSCADSGKLTLSIEGVFEYVSPMSATKAGPSQITPGRHTHVFYRDEAVIPLYVSSEPARSRPVLRSALATIRRTASQERILRPTLPKVRSMEFGFGRDRSSSSASSSSSSCSSGSSSTVSWTSASSVDSSASAAKTFNFSFELPRSDRAGDELPPTFSSSNIVSAGVRGRVYAENADVRYRISAVWEALDGSGAQARLEAPILFQPDADFQSLDGLSVPPDSWSETPLSTVDGISNVPIECAVTMPSPAIFPRRTTVPYYVVFTTNPRTRSLATEVKSDATIAVSLVRKVGFYKPNRSRAPLLSEPSPPPPALARRGSEKHERSTNLSSSRSIGDLRSLRKKLRDVMPPMPRLDTSAAVSSVKTGDSPASSPEPPPTPPTPPSASTVANLTSTPSTSSSKERGRKHMLKRVVRSAPPVLSGFRFGSSARGVESDSDVGSPSTSNPSSSVWHKPLPTIPQEGESGTSDIVKGRTIVKKNPIPPSESNNVTEVEFIENKDKFRVTDSRTLHTDVSVGFPKRPKGRTTAAGSHPSLETVSSLPDGLYKGSIPLQKGWFPSLQWNGLTIEYFLEVSVIFDNSVFKGHIPIRLS
ncbi:hypothetical protein SCHPADRAFT_865315 [Schizopora paradoxa]|uniref:Uncharacterized protein n=1 Tax=Schizopora paradoxa TaxID=27342 RepID=A0A0H2S675_9AGAM|nr:hypothetical protein SCHPADRAFT_865315 [Schizopora paradoxa]